MGEGSCLMAIVGRTSDYDQMLQKIALGTIAATTFLTWILTIFVPSVGKMLAIPGVTYKIDGDIQISLTYLLPGLIFGIISRVFKMHDKISDFLQIRHRFDVQEILLPLAGSAGIAIDLAKRNRIEGARDNLMNDCFYAYASSPEPAAVNKNLIKAALDNWTWYWVALEATFVCLVFVGLFLYYRVFSCATFTCIGIFILCLFLHYQRGNCVKSAHAEVREIVKDTTRKTNIAGVFNEVFR